MFVLSLAITFRQASCGANLLEIDETLGVSRYRSTGPQCSLLLSNTKGRESARLQVQEAMCLWVQMREPGKQRR